MNIVNAVEQAVNRATEEISALSDEILELRGMSSRKVRHLLNNLCAQQHSAYLEIGTYSGSTLCSALFGNQSNVEAAYAVDHWRQFGGFDECQLRISKFLPAYGTRLTVLDGDMYQIGVERIVHPVTVFFYDGAHSKADTRNGICKFAELCAQEFVLVVDDWNFPGAKRGTQEALKQMRLTLLREWVLPARFNGDRQLWWNGLYLAAVAKKPC
jgi:hypothetical protein